jgi:dihydrofolate synthase/folylpolyglutamate synthase
MYQLQGASAYKKDLTNVQVLMDYLGHPESQLQCIHVAGTNGKGSCSHMLASVLQEAGFKVGLYTSPHLKDFRERIKINGQMVSEAFVCDFVNQHQSFFEANDMSFFEMSVGLAFDYFTKEKIDIAIIEVGMGGRLDATNVISPLVSVITNIGLDHTQFLGNTLAWLLASILRKHSPFFWLQPKPIRAHSTLHPI